MNWQLKNRQGFHLKTTESCSNQWGHLYSSSLGDVEIVNSNKYITRFSTHLDVFPPLGDKDKAYLGHFDPDSELNSQTTDEIIFASDNCKGDMYLNTHGDDAFYYAKNYGLKGDPSFGRVITRSSPDNGGTAYYIPPNPSLVALEQASYWMKITTYEGTGLGCASSNARYGYQLFSNDPAITGYQDSYQLPFRSEIVIPSQ